jgi:hypothetical protein
MHRGNETALIAEAAAVIGDGERILTAGVFGLWGRMMEDPGPAPTTTDQPTERPVEPPDPDDLTLRILVAVTATSIYLLRPSGDDRVERRLDRASTDVRVQRWGFTKIVYLDDRTTGEHIEIHAGTAPYQWGHEAVGHVIAELTAA